MSQSPPTMTTLKSGSIASNHQFPFPSLFTMISIFFILLMIPSATSLDFNFTSFSPYNDNITYEGSAYPRNQIIQLTQAQSASIGWATYVQPLHLWDKASGNLTDFTTHFSFVIDTQNRSGSHGDGIAFFLMPADSQKPNVTKGGGLGLASDTQPLNTTVNHFVAVEFDIYKNRWDPNDTHAGIDINSVQSIRNVKWWDSIINGRRNDAWISYNSSSKNLSVVFTGFRNDSTILQDNLYYEVDLRLYLPEWVSFGFSGATGNASAIHAIYSWSFSSSLQTDENKTNPTSPEAETPTSNPNSNPSRKIKVKLVVGLTVGGCAFVGGLSLVLFLFLKSRRGKVDNPVIDQLSMEDDFEKGTGPKKFRYNELASSTNNFAEEGKLGEGGFGGVYKGFLKELDSYIAVKRVSSGSKQGIKEYVSEVKIISRLRHRNLVQLIGWCHEKRDLLLVYEFMPNGSLESHIFSERSLLTWEMRYKIAQGLASALLYLHEGWEQCVLHRDIKSSNIMLDSGFNAKLGDFGLARLVDHGKGSQTTVLAGTMGYMAPECATTGKASKQSDIYSFGVVALEIACGRKPINLKAKEDQIMMLEWVWDLYGKGNILEAADPKLCAEFDAQQMQCLMTVGLWCAHPDRNLRPSVREVIHVLNFEAPLPILPPKMPVPTYSIPGAMSAILLPASSSTTASERSQTQLSIYCTDSSKITTSSAASSPSATLISITR